MDIYNNELDWKLSTAYSRYTFEMCLKGGCLPKDVFYYAVQNGLNDADFYKKLITEHKIDINEAQFSVGKKAIHILASRGANDAVKLFVEFGADIFATDSFGRTPLECAQENLQRLNLDKIYGIYTSFSHQTINIENEIASCKQVISFLSTKMEHAQKNYVGGAYPSPVKIPAQSIPSFIPQSQKERQMGD
ncbi:MAG: ankyrin repeat domain-containing protein [Alphaproteobacteria bacterium]|nr:ankyrin repeat domain-containing protein [Alphaproteobacteria bacterium]